ncbi:hypothetical protein, partial [Ilumatobacter sp.]|uniref:hypothetical protein n=1 Tax=Ilumatobacter sp. TaxID=1967498 RepID=UPI003C5638FA
APALPATALWATDGADSAVLEWRGQTASVPVSGQQAICVAPGDNVVLTAVNSGGQDVRSQVF